MNTNEVQSEPTELQPGSYTADALAASVEETFATLFKQIHPPVLAVNSNPIWVGVEKKAIRERQG